MILDDLRDAHATFSSNEDDLLQPLPLLPMEEIERHILSIIESRNKKLTGTWRRALLFNALWHVTSKEQYLNPVGQQKRSTT